MKSFKLYELVNLNAQSAFTKIAQSTDMTPSFSWDVADFLLAYETELKKFNDVQDKIRKSNIVDEELDEVKYIDELNVVLEKEVKLDCSVLDSDELKKVNLTPIEAVAIKVFL